MHPFNCPISTAIIPDAPCDKAMATQSVHELARQAGSPLFLCVRPSLILSLSSAAIRRELKILPTELTPSFCHSFALFSLLNALVAWGKILTGEWQILLILQYVPIFILTPRFVMSIRELHARDVQGRCGEGIDSGFGLLSSRHGAVGTVIMFADVEQDEGSEDVEEVPREVVTTQSE